MQLNLNSTEGKLLVIVLTCMAIYWTVKAIAKKAQQKKPHTKELHHENGAQTWNWDTEKKWTTSGWYYDEAKEKWVSPDYTNARKNTKMPTVFLTPEEQELAKQIRIDRNGPTFEEWKAARMKEQQEKQN